MEVLILTLSVDIEWYDMQREILRAEGLKILARGKSLGPLSSVRIQKQDIF